MTVPVLVYSVDTSGKRQVTIDGGVKLDTNGIAAPAGTLDIKTIGNGQKLLSIAGDLHEPVDIAIMRKRL